jgi:cytochrome c oxidase cbb3-type subunit 1
VIRVCGGLLYLTGMVIMAWNTIMTVANGRAVPTPIPAVAAHA